MKVAFISNSVFDGAGIAAYRIFQSVLGQGAEGVFYSNDEKTKPHVRRFSPSSDAAFISYFKKKYNWLYFRKPSLEVLPQYEYFTIPRLDHSTTFKDLGYQPDLIHLHWINNILDFPSFFKSIPQDIPVVLTLHDMSMITGGCIYAWDCRKFENQCNQCPQLPGNHEKDLAYRAHLLKNNLFKNRKVHVTADSVWLGEQAKASKASAFFSSLNVLHYPIDVNLFRPMEKELAKKELGLPEDKFLICFGATYVNSRRKGLSILLKALEILYKENKDIHCIVYGKNYQEPDGYTLPNFTSFGNIDSELSLSKIYSAADLFVIPSIAEAFGQTCLEAMSCGTPVIGFNVGGIPDMIKPGQTGFLANAGDAEELSRHINSLISDTELRLTMGKKARDLVVSEFSMEVQGRKYLSLYDEILGS